MSFNLNLKKYRKRLQFDVKIMLKMCLMTYIDVMFDQVYDV